MNIEAQKEHKLLQKMIGEWTYEHKVIMEPGKPPTTLKGTDSVRSLGDLWVLCEGRGVMTEGGLVTSLMTLGYDPQKKRFVGTFIASMMTHLWIYEAGSLDSSGKALSLEAEGPSMASDGKMAKYKDVIEFKSDDHRMLRAFVLGDDGNWFEFMTSNYWRKK